MQKKVEYKGVPYESLKELISEQGYNYESVMKAVGRRKIEVTEYLDLVESGEIKPRSFKYEGVKYKSMTECVEKLIPSMTIIQFTARKNYLGISIKECLDRTLAGEFDYRFEVQGEQYTSVQECIEAHDLRYNEVYNVFRNRKLQNEMTIYEFLEKYFSGEIEHRLVRVEYDGKPYKSITQLIEEKGYDKSTFYAMKIELDYEKSIDLVADVDNGIVPISKVTVQKPYGFTYNGIFYKSQNKFFTDNDTEDSPYSRSEYTKMVSNGEVTDIIDYLNKIDIESNEMTVN